MEVLGPNPRATLTYLQNFVDKQAAQAAAGQAAHFPQRSAILGRKLKEGGGWATTQNPEDYARSMIKLSEDMWDLYRGHTGAAVNQRIAAVWGGARRPSRYLSAAAGARA